MVIRLTEKELVQLAIEAGFETPESTIGLSGDSEFDESVYCGEYPVGKNIKRLAKLLGVTVIEGDK